MKQPLFEVLRYSAAMMNITQKPAFHGDELKLLLVLYKQLLYQWWLKMGPFPTPSKSETSLSPPLFELMVGYVCKGQKAPS